jgi:hypothetical protein
MPEDDLYRIRKRIVGCVRRVQRVAIVLREISETELIPPTPEEYEVIASETEADLVPFSAHLAGVLDLLRFHLLEVGVIYREHLKGVTPKVWDRQVIVRLDSQIERSLGYAVRYHYRKPNPEPPLPGYIPWDEQRKKTGKA